MNLIRFGKKNTPSKKVPLTIAKIVPKGCLVVDFLNTICIWKEKGELVLLEALQTNRLNNILHTTYTFTDKHKTFYYNFLI